MTWKMLLEINSNGCNYCRSQSTASTDEDKPDQGDWGSDFEEPAEVSTARANHAIEKNVNSKNLPITLDNCLFS